MDLHSPAPRMDTVPFSGIREIFEECDRLEADGVDVVHLEIGRPDFDTPEPIKRAATEALEAGHVHYTSNYGIVPLRETIAEKFATENDVSYDPNGEIVVTAGATEAIFVSILALVDDGDEVLLPDPAWTYAAHVELAGGTPVAYDLDPDDEFQPDVDALADAVTDRTKLLIVNSPQNPTGSVLRRERAEAIRDVAVEHDLLVLSDEIYEHITYDGAVHHSLAAMDDMHERTITVNGASKAYSMTGWRLGYLGAPTELIDPIVRARQYTTTCAPSLSQWAAVRAVGSDLHEPMVEAFADRRDRVSARIDAIPGMTCPEPAGAFYAFPTIPDGFDDEVDFARSLLAEAGVATVPGTVFGEVGEGRIRIAYSNSLDRIDEAFDRLEDWL
ncbi:pyridoxal phosphate-dependent aminotransferase [Halovivax gelatinilyticus]|uniref:pyridoxal phosphate-dependent aminotransferase n=1 Tax=Halovivax gelatinilyticus TaxID=2961597 RepID=UPI0020CA8877|nr:pyridoxal phosphate-dependent aminotransferase [Halovivax gelatinilyticus]